MGSAEADYDPEEYETYKAQALELGDGAVTLHLPKEWEIRAHEFFHAKLAVTWIEGAHLFIALETYEDPEAIRANDLERFVTGPHLPDLAKDDLVYDENGVPDYQRITQRAGGYAVPDTQGAADVREAFRLWRRIGVLKPNHVRTVEAHLYVPEEEAESERAEEARRFLDATVPETVFADRETAADRVAASPALSRICLWDTICMRIPADWPAVERENDDGTGMYLFDDEGADNRWTLWIDYDAYRTDASCTLGPADEFATRLANKMRNDKRNVIEVLVDPMPDRPDEAVTKIVYGSVENGEKLRHISWHKVANRDRMTILAHFTWVIREFALNDPDIIALTELVERECCNAVLVDRQAAAVKRPPAGAA